MQTEDEMARALHDGAMSVDDVIAAVSGEDQVFVYPDVAMVEGSETWDQVGEAASASSLFTELRAAGATEEQMEQIGVNVERLRMAGRTIDKVYAWTPEEVEAAAEAVPAAAAAAQ
jgi:hypothetical protein